jgi:hypothetical protein
MLWPSSSGPNNQQSIRIDSAQAAPHRNVNEEKEMSGLPNIVSKLAALIADIEAFKIQNGLFVHLSHIVLS